MTGEHGTAAPKRMGAGSAALPPEAWTAAGYYSRTRRPGAAKFDALLGNLKARGVPLAEGVERHAIRSINLARQDVVFVKVTRTWIVVATILGGFTLGSMWFATPRRKELPGETGQ